MGSAPVRVRPWHQANVRDRRPVHDARIPHQFIDDERIGAVPFRVYVALVRFANWQTGSCRVGLELLGLRARLEDRGPKGKFRALRAAIASLEALGYVRVTRINGRPYVYDLIAPEPPPAPPAEDDLFSGVNSPPPSRADDPPPPTHQTPPVRRPAYTPNPSESNELRTTPDGRCATCGQKRTFGKDGRSLCAGRPCPITLEPMG